MAWVRTGGACLKGPAKQPRLQRQLLELDHYGGSVSNHTSNSVRTLDVVITLFITQKMCTQEQQLFKPI